MNDNIDFERNCVFCKMSNGQIKSDIIYENDNFFSVFDINPITKGHSLVISKKHFHTVLDLPNTLGSELIDCIKKTSVVVMKKFKAEGFNVVNNNFSVAGQAVNHVHFHVIPRNKSDGLKGFF